MKYDVITLFPEIIESYCASSITKRGIDSGIISVKTYNPREFSKDKHRKVDDTPYGGGDGMVLACQPIYDCYNSIERLENSLLVMLSPQGEKFSQKISKDLAKFDQIILLCGHYEGFDERIRTLLSPREISIGDYVLTGGELASLVIIDSVSRNLPDYLNKEGSAHFDSFSEGLDGLLEYPQYTKPREFMGLCVPNVLLNGNHKEIAEFRKAESIKRTKAKRPDLLKP